jgi:prepilin-type processing-associated H-X9-DG protein
MKSAASHREFTLIELLVVLGILAVLIGLIVPAVQRVRSSAARLQCQNKLRQIGLGLHAYHDAQGALPPGVRGEGSPYPFMTWLTRILPYVEQDSLWTQAVYAYGVDANFAHAPHPFATVVKLYGCPADQRTSQVGLANGTFRVAFTSFLGVEGRNQSRKDGCLFLDSSVRLTDITDGTSNTLLVGERPPSPDGSYGWWYAGTGQLGPAGGPPNLLSGSGDSVLGVRERNVALPLTCPLGPSAFGPGRFDNPCDMLHFWSPHLGGGANFLFADASVHFLPYSAAPIMSALSTRSGGEVVPGSY